MVIESKAILNQQKENKETKKKVIRVILSQVKNTRIAQWLGIRSHSAAQVLILG